MTAMEVGLGQYPESEKLGAIQDHRVAITEFIEWASNHAGLELSAWDEDEQRYDPTDVVVDRLIMQFYGINPVKLEQERRAMLESLGGEL